jgi:hypothetical protein
MHTWHNKSPLFFPPPFLSREAKREGLSKEEPEHPANVRRTLADRLHAAPITGYSAVGRLTGVISSLTFISAEVIGRQNRFKFDCGCQQFTGL